MRLNLFFCVAFLTTCALGLVIPLGRLSGSPDESSLRIREVSPEGIDDYALLKREPKRTNARKARTAAAKVVANQRKAGFNTARQAHKNTIGLPNRKTVYHVPHGGGKPSQTYTGKEVRKTLFQSHLDVSRKHLMSGSKRRRLHIVPFDNRAHDVAKKHVVGGSKAAAKGKTRVVGHKKPIPGMASGPSVGQEIPLPHHASRPLLHGQRPLTGPARIITQQNKRGHHVFRGVVAHDQTRPKGTYGQHDHFKVKGAKPRRRVYS